jgi:hypothetical protein
MAALPSSAGQGSWSVVTLGADAADQRAYADLVAGAPASPITHTLVWRDLLLGLGLGQPVYWVALRDGQPRAALPAFVRRSPAGAVLNSLPFVQSTGGVITPRDAGPGERAWAVALLVEAMLAFCRDHEVRVACLIGSPYRGLGDAEAFSRPPDFQMVRATNALELSRPTAPRPSIAGSITKARRFAPQRRVAASPAEARAIYDLYAASMRRLEVTPHPWALYEPLVGRGARFVAAEVDGQLASALILLVHGEVLEYHSVGNSEAGRAMQTGSWLIAEELAWARAQNVRWWNWGASPSKAVHDFKKRWGGVDLPFPIWGWCLGDVAAWRRLTPRELAAEFPSYFVLPYDQLRSA